MPQQRLRNTDRGKARMQERMRVLWQKVLRREGGIVNSFADSEVSDLWVDFRRVFYLTIFFEYLLKTLNTIIFYERSN